MVENLFTSKVDVFRPINTTGGKFGIPSTGTTFSKEPVVQNESCHLLVDTNAIVIDSSVKQLTTSSPAVLLSVNSTIQTNDKIVDKETKRSFIVGIVKNFRGIYKKAFLMTEKEFLNGQH